MNPKPQQLALEMAPQSSVCRLREIVVKSVITPSRLTDYCLNPYAGCEHGCVYCYARFASRFSHPNDKWGSFVDVRVNVPLLVQKEAPRKRPGRVFVSSVSDAWQPVEEKYGLTRQCLEVLLRYNYPLLLHTKSALVQRDFDLIRSHPEVEFGMTITTVEPRVAALFEPKASPPQDRIGVLNRARDMGIRTFVFLGPLLPYISDRGEGLTDLLEMVGKVNPESFLVDCLNPRYGIWPSLSAALAEYRPALIPAYRKILYDRVARQQYIFELRQRISEQARQHGLIHKMQLCL